MLEKTLESPLDSKEIKPVKAERGEGGLFRCLFSPSYVRSSFAHSFIQHTTGCLCGVQVDSDGPSSGPDGEMEEVVVGWHHWHNGHEFEQTPGDTEGVGGLACCSPSGGRELDTT